MKRTPMKRGPWGTSHVATPEYRAEQRAKNMRVLMLVEGLPATMAGTTTGPAPKGPKAKPGKGAPTQEEKRWLDSISAFGCVACWLDGSPSRPAAVHHVLRGGRRMGHLYSLPLCQPGHHMDGQTIGMVSRHPHKARFEAKYGTEQHLLSVLQDKLGFPQLLIEAPQ